MSQLKTLRLEPRLRDRLIELYNQIMWLARRPHVPPSMARAWYTHVVAGRFKNHLRRFSGRVSRSAAFDLTAQLTLEHYRRLQNELTNLIKSHLKSNKPKPSDFIQVLLDCEQVHIVTVAENAAAQNANGD